MATRPRSVDRSERPQIGSVDGLAQLAFAVGGMLEQRAGAQGLSLAQTRLLGVLRDRRPSINELARLLGLDKSSTSGLVDRAERRGLVSRRPSPTDGRGVHVELTAAGRALAGIVAAEFAADMTALLADLSAADRQDFTALVSRILVDRAARDGVDLFASVDPGALS